MLLTLLALPLALLAAASPVAAPDDSALAPRQDWGLGAPAYSSVLQPGDGETATTDRTKCIGVANATAGAYLTLQPCTAPHVRWRFHAECIYSPTWLQLDGTNLCARTVGGRNPDWNGYKVFLVDCPTAEWPTICTSSPKMGKWTYLGLQLSLGGFCLDNTNGKREIGNPIQVWKCHRNGDADYNNQKWFMYRGPM